MMDVSVVIRAYNEAKGLQRLLDRLHEQRFDGAVELVVVDNGSSDDTAEVARRAGVAVVTLPQAEFSYPRSLNVGLERATAPVVICTVAHAYPERRDWIATGVKYFAKPRVAGVFSFTLPHTDATVWDRALLWPGYAWTRLRGPVAMRRSRDGSGTFGALNIALRRSVWLEHPFDEAYGAGGEDTAWAAWALAQGYRIMRDPAFVIRHSHYLRNFAQASKQMKFWRDTGKPRRFDPAELAFREKPWG